MTASAQTRGRPREDATAHMQVRRIRADDQ